MSANAVETLELQEGLLAMQPTEASSVRNASDEDKEASESVTIVIETDEEGNSCYLWKKNYLTHHLTKMKQSKHFLCFEFCFIAGLAWVTDFFLCGLDEITDIISASNHFK